MTAFAISHLVVASPHVQRIASFFTELFRIPPVYQTSEFADFVLPSRTRVAFFTPAGKSAKFFDASSSRSSVAFGITVTDVDELFQRAETLAAEYRSLTSGPPQDHPWGERSFLLIDPDGNRWEITQTPSQDGFLEDRGDNDARSGGAR